MKKVLLTILNFCHMLPPHIGVEISNTIIDCLKVWGLEKKIISLTLDNVFANDNMQDIQKTQLFLNDNWLCDGEYFHVCCCDHILTFFV